MNRKNITNIIIIFFIVILGIICVKQAKVTAKERGIIKEENMMQLAYEIIESSDSNFNLQNEINRLRVKNDSFSLDIKDKVKIKDDLEEKLQSYELINGVEEIIGRGVEIIIDGDIITEEMVDLINSIRNTKPEAIGINGKRVIYRSYFLAKDGRLEFDNNNFGFPFSIQIIGDVDVLENSLTRSGGILDIIKQNSFGKINSKVEVKDDIVLPAYNGKISFKEAKITN